MLSLGDSLCKNKGFYCSFQASDLIRSALMGHSMRRHQMQHYRDDDDDDYMTDDEDYNDCVNLIQSAMLGHNQRRTRMKENQ